MVFTYWLLQELMWGWVVQVQQPELHGRDREEKERELTSSIWQGLWGRSVTVCGGTLGFAGVFPAYFSCKEKAFKHCSDKHSVCTQQHAQMKTFLTPDNTQCMRYCVRIPLRNRRGLDSCGQIMECFLCIHGWNGLIGFTWFRDQIRPCLKEQANQEWEEQLSVSIQVGKNKEIEWLQLL